jgi:hypothetical protein
MSKVTPLGIPELCGDITRTMFATLACLSTLLIQLQLPCYAEESGTKLATLYEQQVDRRLNLPEEEQRRYVGILDDALSEAGLHNLAPQYVVLVDRNVFVQAAMIFWKSGKGELSFIGASPASTGNPGQFEHFETPIGVFDHTLDNLDFRAEGTRNEFGILGYGTKGMRIYDFGWLKAPKGWGDGIESIMRLQLHATDPDSLEPRLGSAQSKGCIRIPATLNTFIDHYGILDADYDRAVAEGRTLWVLNPSREPTPWSGRYMVVVDTKRDQRPFWSPLPRIKGH